MGEMALETSVALFLKGIEDGWSDPSQRLRLAHQFLRDSWLIERGKRIVPHPSASPGPGDAIDGLEAVLARVTQLAEHPSPMKVQDAKRWLRVVGPDGASIAASIGSLSKTRNTQAHPKVHRILLQLGRLAQHMRPFDGSNHDEDEYGKDGFGRNDSYKKGYHKNVYDVHGMDKDGLNQAGYEVQGFDKNGYDKLGFDHNGYNAHGFDHNGYDHQGFNELGFGKDGYNKYGYDKEGRDKNGYDVHGMDKGGFNQSGYDSQGFDKNGYDKQGFDNNGFNANGFDKNGYDKEGYDEQGFDINGYDKHGYDKNGYNYNGSDKDGYHRDCCKFFVGDWIQLDIPRKPVAYGIVDKVEWNSDGHINYWIKCSTISGGGTWVSERSPYAKLAAVSDIAKVGAQ